MVHNYKCSRKGVGVAANSLTASLLIQQWSKYFFNYWDLISWDDCYNCDLGYWLSKKVRFGLQNEISCNLKWLVKLLKCNPLILQFGVGIKVIVKDLKVILLFSLLCLIYMLLVLLIKAIFYSLCTQCLCHWYCWHLCYYIVA